MANPNYIFHYVISKNRHFEVVTANRKTSSLTQTVLTDPLCFRGFINGWFTLHVSGIILPPKALKLTPVYSTGSATAAAGEMHFYPLFFFLDKQLQKLKILIQNNKTVIKHQGYN